MLAIRTESEGRLERIEAEIEEEERVLSTMGTRKKKKGAGKEKGTEGDEEDGEKGGDGETEGEGKGETDGEGDEEMDGEGEGGTEGGTEGEGEEELEEEEKGEDGGKGTAEDEDEDEDEVDVEKTRAALVESVAKLKKKKEEVKEYLDDLRLWGVAVYDEGEFCDEIERKDGDERWDTVKLTTPDPAPAFELSSNRQLFQYTEGETEKCRMFTRQLMGARTGAAREKILLDAGRRDNRLGQVLNSKEAFEMLTTFLRYEAHFNQGRITSMAWMQKHVLNTSGGVSETIDLLLREDLRCDRF
jgi:hypothetical protein